MIYKDLQVLKYFKVYEVVDMMTIHNPETFDFQRLYDIFGIMNTGNHQNISAFILAGGRSRRFGENKAMTPYQGRPLILHIREILAGCFDSVSIIAKPDSSYRSLDCLVIDDVSTDQSPLVGIYTGLLNSKTEWSFFTGCDMPFITCQVVEQLTDAMAEDRINAEIIVPVTPHGIEPLAALYHKSLTETLSEESSSIALRSFIRSRNYRTVEFKSTKPFTNVNTKAQLVRIDR